MCVKGHFDPLVQIVHDRQVSDDDTPLHKKNMFKLDIERSIMSSCLKLSNAHDQ